MSNLPPNPFNNIPGAPQPNTLTGPQMFPPNQQFGQVPLSQLPPGYGGVKQDANSNSPMHLPSSTAQNNALQNMNNFNQSANSSPAFNQPGMLPIQQTGFQSSPNRLPPKPAAVASSPNLIPPYSSANPSSVSNANSSPFPPNYNPPQRQINDNASPLMPSSQLNQPLMNGPPLGPIGPPKPLTSSPYPVTSKPFSPPPMSIRPPISGIGPEPGAVNPTLQQGTIGLTNPKPPAQQQGMLPPQPNIPFSGPPRSSPLIPGPTVSRPIFNGPPVPSSNTSGPLGQRPIGSNGPSGFSGAPPVSGFPIGGAGLPGHMSMSPMSGPPKMPSTGVPPLQSYPGPSKTGPGPGQPMAPSGLLGNTNQVGGPPSQPPGPHPQSFQLPAGPQTFSAGPQTFPAGPQTFPPGPQTYPPGSQTFPAGPQTFPTGLSGPSGQQVGPSMNVQPGPPSGPPMSGPPMSGPPKSNMQNRYPPMPQGNYVTQQPQPGMGKPYPQQYTNQALTQQMGQLSVTKQGFDQLWGHQMVDLLQCKHILPEYPEDPPEIKLGHQFADAPNCSPDIFRCTINRIPETNSLLQKSRLPLGILIHPFKDLNHLPVIQCATIVRCRACRTYINPFVYFVDAKRWKCNLCYRVNDLPEEFQYDPVSKSYGDPTRRPEIKSATIEFIAPGEYMLRPPQPAVYLFLLDVSQIARESGYLQVVCDTLNANLDQLPGDARTQIGFICYDAHVHYYLMSDDLTRPKEMTVLDIDDVFLPSPESLLVNLGERRSVVRQLLSSLPARHAAPGVPASALGAALQAAYKLMAPTGGRITVFQTCLPNVGPGALQAREDPNARSSKDVAHLAPASDFYKRLALDCSGAQVAVDLFLLNSQYADLSTLCGMSKFSAGTVYHIPLFRAARAHHADKLTRMLTRYLTRKIGFEAVMRVRCTRGIAIHTFHGNFFVRSTDLLSLPNVSPDAGFGMQLTIEESLADLQQVCFQAALLYTSSKGERRIRVHTMALPICTTLPEVLHAADQHCIVGLLAKMAVDRCVSASMSEAREALINVSIDVLSAHKVAQNLPAGALSAALHAPMSLRLLPLYLLALLKRRAFRTGTSTRLDDRVADMCDMKTLPLPQLLRAVYPELYAIDALRSHTPPPDPETEYEGAPDPPRLQLSAERINSTGAYLLDDGDTMIVYVGHAASPAFLSDTFGVAAFSQLPDEARSLPRVDSEGNALLHHFVDKLNDDRPYAADVLLLKENSPSRQIFTERLVDDRVESAFSYYEFLQHVKSQVK